MTQETRTARRGRNQSERSQEHAAREHRRDQAMFLYRSGQTQAAIGRVLHCSVGTVNNDLKLVFERLYNSQLMNARYVQAMVFEAARAVIAGHAAGSSAGRPEDSRVILQALDIMMKATGAYRETIVHEGSLDNPVQIQVERLPDIDLTKLSREELLAYEQLKEKAGIMIEGEFEVVE